jgi:hypothetical protein
LLIWQSKLHVCLEPAASYWTLGKLRVIGAVLRQRMRPASPHVGLDDQHPPYPFSNTLLPLRPRNSIVTYAFSDNEKAFRDSRSRFRGSGKRDQLPQDALQAKPTQDGRKDQESATKTLPQRLSSLTLYLCEN